jgi:hypothetical protein
VARHLLCAWLVFVSILSIASPAAQAATPSEKLLPNTTVGYLSIPDVDVLREKWNLTQLGLLFDDPAMKPFVEDLNAQLKSKLSKTGIKLGITWEDLNGVYAGEICLAAVQPNHDAKLHALVLLMDVTGKQAQADALLKKVTDSQTAKGGKVSTKKVLDIDVTVIQLGGKAVDVAEFAYYAIVNEQLIASDHEATLVGILAQAKTPSEKTLSTVQAYEVAMGKVAEAVGDAEPQAKWYLDPFRYAEVARAMNGGKKKRGKDILTLLREEGFGAIQGAAGYVLLATGEQEVLHRSFVYAPADPKAAKGDKYQLAARMLQFPNEATKGPPAWVPQSAATFLSLNWKVGEAFDKYVGSIVDRFADGEGIYEEVLLSIKEDPNGPQVDLRKDLIAHLSERLMVMTDCVEPIDVNSERLMVAIELKDAVAVEKTVNKAMSSDPDARKRVHNGHVIWEIVSEEETEFTVDEIKIDGPGFIGTEEVVAVGAIAAPDEDRVLPNSAVTVVHGHLIVASHVDFIVKVLDAQPQTLDAAEDFVRVGKALDGLGAGTQALRHFVRTDKAYMTTYELVRQNKMPEAKTVLGKVLNRLFASDEDDESMIVRQQQIDGTKMPEFEKVREYLGPAGFYVQSEDDGWLVSGCLLKR